MLAARTLAALVATTTVALAQPTPAPMPPPDGLPTPADLDEPAPTVDAAPPAEPTEADEPAVVKPERDEPAPVAHGAMVTLGGVTDARSYAKDWLVAPPGYHIGGELRFITAGTSPDGPRIKFTDLAILRLHGRTTLGRRIELAGSLDLLAKQPDSRTDLFFQGGGFGLKVATSRRTAITAAASGGPTMGDDGFWASVGTGVTHRSRIEKFLAFQYGGGASATGLRLGEAPTEWQAGLAGTSELIFHTPHGEWAMWLGFDLELPIVHSDALDPRSRLGVTIGQVFAAVRDWDLYASFSWRDRGTTDLPATTLPIVDGGFDQKQFAIGLTRRFSVRGKSARWALAM
ncbi:MAG: hypothetical protein KBG48_25875 [Kofleriaceae bacterium]|nr:hypothetical protein [Kofleriaceae bacterium]MBP9170853.1 hypothetical protein [Kofleriaceae bacterium]MBP9857632.1 hypothetical protein [Kofleriaceae bacterium]